MVNFTVRDEQCYHCGLPIPPHIQLQVSILQTPRSMCCAGCAAVASAIVENGLEAYYQHRSQPAHTATELIPQALQQLEHFDHPAVQQSFVIEQSASIKQASLILQGITCAACVWLNERHLKQLQGVLQVSVNYTSHRARITWDNNIIALSHILAEIQKLGYEAHPFSAQQQEALRQQQRKQDFRRLAVAGLSAGQVMMIAVALYAGANQGLELATGQLLRWFSLVLSVPAISYAAWPFYRAAWRSLKRRSLSMDVPVSLGLLTGFAGSVWATINATGAVYFDTLTMLIFFLLGTRYLERNAREKSIEAAENLLRLTPALANKVSLDLHGETSQQLVTVSSLKIQDQILIKPGESIAADGRIVSGNSSVDESLLTGESRALPKKIGDMVYAGSINYESPITISISALAENTLLAGIARLLDRAQAEKPRLAQMADRIGAWFTSALLIAVCLIAAFWVQHDASRMLEIVLTVLVVSCPCALSLAAPAAFAAAGSHLVQRGVLLTRGHALETLAKTTHMVFDKTGTLSLGQPSLMASHTYGELSAEQCLQIAASLEQHSEHSIAHSLIAAAQHLPLLPIHHAQNIPGQGVIGEIAGLSYQLGNAQLHAQYQDKLQSPNITAGASQIWLMQGEHLLASFILSDQAKADTTQLLSSLQTQGLRISLLSGDSVEAVAHFAEQHGIERWRGACSPQGKLDYIRQLQAQGEVVCMVGDGINDAPVLAGAQVSIAMGHGTQMARASGDIVLLSEHLIEISKAVTTSRLGLQIIRQNFIWAAAYNLFALPFAACGLISPWLAAIGMSVSSLIVVLNALRLR
jgi:P-type Cu2+ transporter